MGSFVQTYLNPLSGGPAMKALMDTPEMQKLNHDDPLISALHGAVGNALFPSSEQSANEYLKNNPQPAGPTSYAGITPTLGDANKGYTGTPSGASYNPNVNTQLYGMTPATQANGSDPNSTLAKQQRQQQSLGNSFGWGS